MLKGACPLLCPPRKFDEDAPNDRSPPFLSGGNIEPRRERVVQGQGSSRETQNRKGPRTLAALRADWCSFSGYADPISLFRFGGILLVVSAESRGKRLFPLLGFFRGSHFYPVVRHP